MPGGGLVAAGKFTLAGGFAVSNIARWNGASWSGLSAGLGNAVNSFPNTAPVSSLCVLPNGDVVAGGAFTAASGIAANRIARWNGAAWSALGTGMVGLGQQDEVLALELVGAQLFAGGDFALAGGQVSSFVARYAAPCAATVVTSGAACASSGGANSYAALSQPWTGATYRTRGTGLPNFAFVAVVNGFSGTAVPLGAVLAPSPAGCTLWASPDVVDVTISNAGTVDAQIVLPNTPSLAGTVLHQQLVALQVDANLNFVQNTSTNGLVATVGAF